MGIGTVDAAYAVELDSISSASFVVNTSYPQTSCTDLVRQA